MTDADKVAKPQHFGTDPTDIRCVLTAMTAPEGVIGRGESDFKWEMFQISRER